MKCRKCQFENPEGIGFCINCGTALEPPTSNQNPEPYGNNVNQSNFNNSPQNNVNASNNQNSSNFNNSSQNNVNVGDFSNVAQNNVNAGNNQNSGDFNNSSQNNVNANVSEESTGSSVKVGEMAASSTKQAGKKSNEDLIIIAVVMLFIVFGFFASKNKYKFSKDEVPFPTPDYVTVNAMGPGGLETFTIDDPVRKDGQILFPVMRIARAVVGDEKDSGVYIKEPSTGMEPYIYYILGIEYAKNAYNGNWVVCVGEGWTSYKNTISSEVDPEFDEYKKELYVSLDLLKYILGDVTFDESTLKLNCEYDPSLARDEYGSGVRIKTLNPKEVAKNLRYVYDEPSQTARDAMVRCFYDDGSAGRDEVRDAYAEYYSYNEFDYFEAGLDE